MLWSIACMSATSHESLPSYKTCVFHKIHRPEFLSSQFTCFFFHGNFKILFLSTTSRGSPTVTKYENRFFHKRSCSEFVSFFEYNMCVCVSRKFRPSRGLAHVLVHTCDHCFTFMPVQLLKYSKSIDIWRHIRSKSSQRSVASPS